MYIIFVFHKQSEKGAVLSIYIVQYKTVNNTAGTHKYMMPKTVLSGWFFYWVNTWTRDI